MWHTLDRKKDGIEDSPKEGFVLVLTFIRLLKFTVWRDVMLVIRFVTLTGILLRGLFSYLTGWLFGAPNLET